MRRPSRILGPALVLLLATACGGADAPTPAEAGSRLTGWMDTLSAGLTDGVEPLQPWQPGDDGSTEDTDGCGKQQVRRSYTATVDVPDTQDPDLGNRANLLAGQLTQAGWDTTLPTTGSEQGSVSARRKGEDDTGTKLAIEFSPVPGGWHYVVTAKTSCLETG